MSLTFYYAPMSTSNVTEAVLAELGTPCERVNLDISAGDTRKPDFLQVNPNGRVPAIVHEGIAIWESAAITLYLGEVFGVEAQLYPALGPERGEAMKWIVWSNIALAEAAGRLAAALPSNTEGAVESNSLDWVAPDQRRVSAVEQAKVDLDRWLKILNNGLEGKSFLLGEYSLADTHLQAFVGWIASMEVNLMPFPNVMGWLKRCSERPALAKLMSG